MFKKKKLNVQNCFCSSTGWAGEGWTGIQLWGKVCNLLLLLHALWVRKKSVPECLASLLGLLILQ